MDIKLNFPIHKNLTYDKTMIEDIIYHYHAGEFKEMKGLILEYDENCFFTDLYVYLSNLKYSSTINQHLIFAGITIQYFKIYS